MDVKFVIGIIGTLFALSGYVPYLRDLLKGKTKPHAFSWLVWSLIVTIVLVAQIQDGAGVGAWITALTLFFNVIILFFSFWKGEKSITRIDWVSLVLAFVAIALWNVTKVPLYAVIFATIGDLLGFIPTFRKSYHKPFQETLYTFVVSSLKWLLAILALQNYSLVTVLYPAWLFLSNGAFVLMLIVRRRRVSQ